VLYADLKQFEISGVIITPRNYLIAISPIILLSLCVGLLSALVIGICIYWKIIVYRLKTKSSNSNANSITWSRQVWKRQDPNTNTPSPLLDITHSTILITDSPTPTSIPSPSLSDFEDKDNNEDVLDDERILALAEMQVYLRDDRERACKRPCIEVSPSYDENNTSSAASLYCVDEIFSSQQLEQTTSISTVSPASIVGENQRKVSINFEELGLEL
jgi:hypothetical protein